MKAFENIAGKTIAMVRILTGVMFLFFGEYKIASPSFTYGGFEGWIHGFLDQGMPVGLIRPLLANFALVHPVFCARLVGWGELAIGISLTFGFCVRLAAIGGIIEMAALALATWYAPGHGAPAWRYLGANLDHIPLIFLFAVFYATRAGDIWGLDGLRHSRSTQTV